MKNIFSSFGVKIYYWIQFTKGCITTDNPLLKDARKLSKIAKKSLKLIKEADRTMINKKYFESTIAYIIGLYLMIESWHDGIQLLGLTNQKLNMLTFLRPQLETLLIFFYFTEPKDNISEVEKRVNKYLDWVIIKMYQNMQDSSKLSVIKIIPGMKEYEEKVRENYETLKEKYKHKEADLKKLEKSYSFLSNKYILAKSYSIEDLYGHVYAETSSTIHIADISDRMQPYIDSWKGGFIYNSAPKNAFWQLFISNRIMVVTIKRFAEFFNLQKQIKQFFNEIIKN